MQKQWFWSVVVLLLCVGAQPAVAQDKTIPIMVEVEQHASTIDEAKKKALQKSERKAFEKLLVQVAPERAGEILSFINPERIPSFVASFAVKHEKQFAGRYSAHVYYQFDSKRVAHLLKSTEGLAAHIGSGSLLVIPVLHRGAEPFLWEKQNIWKKKVSRYALSIGKGKLLVPYGDHKDRHMLEVRDLASNRLDRIKKLAIRYGAREVVVVMARLHKQNKQFVAELFIHRPGTDSAQVKRSYTQIAGETMGGLLERAAEDIVRQMSSHDKQYALFASSEVLAMKKRTLQVEYSNANEWLKIRKSLVDIPGVDRVEIAAMAPDSARVILHYKGAEGAIAKVMAMRGLRLLQSPTRWVVSVR